MGFAKRNYTGEHLSFKLDESHKGKTGIWYVYSVHDDTCHLGVIKWYWAWRRYVFWPEEETLYDSNCLKTIAEFIDAEMEQRKKEQKEAKK